MKLRTTLLCLMALMLGSFSLTAQTAPSRNCGAMEHLEFLQQQDPKMEDRMQRIEKMTNDYLASPAAKVVDGIITIPVVFHVVYRTTAENLSAAVLQEQLDVMNDDFRRMNSDADNTWSQAADTEIEFCLASVDPDGNATSGITRTSTTTNGFGTNDGVKFDSSGGKDAWPRDSYLNFWVCNIGGGILGYAQFPGGPAATDGVVNDYRYTGITGASAPFDGGRTATHEVGHWLNLRHIWGDGGCGVDDFVADTPESDASNGGCNASHVSCGTTDMVQNYMDYSDDACMNLFTQGQKDRMRAIFEPGGARASLLNSAACGAPADPTCDDGVQNGNETGVDCGGPDCANACPTCDDGIQNGNETDVDCGGDSCNACPCNGSDVTVSITLDNYPEETSWTITDASGNTVASGGTYNSQPDGSTVTETLCLNDGCYDFTITDAYGDGICCTYGNGSYSVTGTAGTLASGSQFTSNEVTNFCLGGGPAPTCDDGEQNGDETGVDCGGSCAPCATCDDGQQNGNETGVDCGGDCDACPTCDDGIQNGSETGVDCGGPDCAACATCDDGQQNGNETGIDCGGDCTPCATCNDGQQNGNETGVDCGGDCDACPTCDDGIQNGNETGVDCGGDCTPCSTGCNDTAVNLTITLDNYPEETAWTLTNDSGTVIGSGGNYGGQADGSSVSDDFCLADGCYAFTITDVYGDGICCAYGNGSYVITDASGAILASGGSFGEEETAAFCIGDVTPEPTCNDGVQNGDETGVDCGGSCAPCDTGGGDCTEGLVDSNDFNSWGIWNDGGSDCRRSVRDAQYANSGDYCIRLRDNSGAASSMTTDELDLSSFEDITVDFNFLAVSMENGEDLWLQISDNGGSSYTTVATWASNDGFTNGTREFESVYIPGPFTASTRLRIRCDASGNGDRVYVDDVVISGCSGDDFTSPIGDDQIAQPVENARQPQTEIAEGISNLNLFPNPATDRLTVAYEISTASTVQIVVTDLTGKIVSRQESDVEAGQQAAKLQINDLNSGIYLLQVISDDARMMKKFVVVK